jgi:L-arabinose isomerase
MVGSLSARPYWFSEDEIMTTRPRIGLFVTALLEDDYNKTGHMRPKMHEATARIAALLEPYGEVVNPGFVEYEPDADRATEVFQSAGVDLVVAIELAYQKGIIPMRTLLRIDAPLLVWNTQQIRRLPEEADFDVIMENSGMAGLPELTSALIRSERPFKLVTSHISDPAGLKRIGEYAAAAGAIRRLSAMRIGMIGHPFEGMTDLMVDYLSLHDRLGPVVWPIEPEKVAQLVAGMNAARLRSFVAELSSTYDTKEMPPELMDRSASLALALLDIAEGGTFDALVTFDQVWLTDPRVGVIPSFGTGYLCAQHIPVATEADVTTSVAMMILQELAGEVTFLENYVIDFDREAIILSHDGHGNPALAADPASVRLKPSIYYEGVNGRGAGLEYAYRPGPVTVLSLIPLGDGEWRLVVAEGLSLEMTPRPVVAPQMLFQYSHGTIAEFCDNWLMAGAPHHMALAYGHLAEQVQDVGDQLEIEVLSV